MRTFPLAAALLALAASAVDSQEPAAAAPPAPASAKTEAGPGGAASIQDVIATIEDPERRARLVAFLKTLVEAGEKSAPEAAAAPARTGLITGLAQFFTRLSDQMKGTAIQVMDQLAKLPDKGREFARSLEEPEVRRRFLLWGAVSLGTVVVAILAGLFAWIPLRRLRARIASPGAERWRLTGRLWRLVVLTLLDAVPIAAFAAAGLLITAVAGAPEAARIITLAVIWAIIFQRAVAIALEAFLSSRYPALRVAPLADGTARSLAAQLGRLAAFGIYGACALQALVGLGTDAALLLSLRSLYGLILLGWGILIVLRYRRPARAYLLAVSERGGSWRSAAVSALGLWWLAAILYLVGLYMIWVSGARGGTRFLVVATVETVGAIIGAALLAALARRLLARFERRLGTFFSRYPEIAARLPQYAHGARVLLHGIILAVAVSLCLEAWGVSALEAIRSQAVQDTLTTAVRIVVIVVLAAAVIDVAAVFTQRIIESREGSGRATGKVRTLAPLARKTVRAMVVIAAGIMILEQLGVNVGPILAGVGVLGLAIGFGAQTLVKDIITGIFMLLEDTLTVGDVVRLGDTAGVVEAINIRTVRVRDVAGSVHTIPYSSVGTVINMSKDYGRHVIDAAVAYREDVEEVIRVLKELGDGLRADAEFGKEILEPIEILGLERFDESAVVVRARLLTRPGQQFRVGREFNRRMKKAFDERGIEMPYPHRTVYFGVDKSGRAPPLHLETVAEDPRAGERLVTENEAG
jgi:small conductance mechanosensitive channel